MNNLVLRTFLRTHFEENTECGELFGNKSETIHYSIQSQRPIKAILLVVQNSLKGSFSVTITLKLKVAPNAKVRARRV